jgi:hypothetical protein
MGWAQGKQRSGATPRDGAAGPAGRKQGRGIRALEGRRKRKGGTDARGPVAREKGGREGAARLEKEVAPTCGPKVAVRGRERGGARGKLGWLLDRAGPRGKEEEEGKEMGCQGKARAERSLGWVGLPFSSLSFASFLFLFYTQLFKQIYVNSNKFEFKP